MNNNITITRARRWLCAGLLCLAGLGQGLAQAGMPKGAVLLVLPGTVKSSDAEFVEACNPDCLMALARDSLSAEGFALVGPQQLGGAWAGYVQAVNLGDGEAAARALAQLQVPRPQWAVKLDLIDTHRMSQQITWTSKDSAGAKLKYATPSPADYNDAKAAQGDGKVRSRVNWRLIMRYQIIDASSTEVLAQGKTELRRDVSDRVDMPFHPLPVAGVPIAAQDIITALRELADKAVAELQTQPLPQAPGNVP